MWEDYPVNLTAVSMDVSDIAMRILVEGTSQHLEVFFMTGLVYLVQQEPKSL